MPTLVYILGALLVVAASVAVYALQLGRERRELLSRADVRMGAAAGGQIAILRNPGDTPFGRFVSWLEENTPETWADAGEANNALVHAGFDNPSAPLVYTTLRLISAVSLPLLTFTLGPHGNLVKLLPLVACALALGVIAPRAILDRLSARRQDRIRKSVPDALDLLVVCVEAGVGLDSAMLRVARDMAELHPELSSEFLIVNRKMGAGITRAEALTGLFDRTGVEELRGLASSMIQSERLGSSIARVLRVYAETLRRKRRQAAEQRAAKAALKMIFPMALLMLPALFALVLGPTLFILADTFAKLNARG